MTTLRNILDANLCSGCGACASLDSNAKVKMKLDNSGYLRPDNIDSLTPLDEQKILQVCPGAVLDNTITQAENYDNVWGPINSLSIAWAKDKDVRHAGSSGGVITALAQFLINQGEVDVIVQTGASKDKPIINSTQISETSKEIISNSGSRYSPSSPLDSLNQFLDTNKKIAVIGKPCDIAALRAILNTHPEYKNNIKYLIAFFCAGVPSIHGTTQLLHKLNIEEEQLYKFNYRGNGWPGEARAVLHDKTEKSLDYDTAWGNILNKHLQLRCKICPDGTGEYADIVCADAWLLDKQGNPLFDEAPGRSVLIARNTLGKELVDQLIGSETIEIVNTNLTELNQMQPYQARRKQLTFARVLAMKTLLKTSPKYHGLGLYKAAIKNNLILTVRNYLGMINRLIKNK